MATFQLRDINGQVYTIVTSNTKLVTEWLAEYLPQMENDYHMAWQLQVWADPNDPAEMTRGYLINWDALASDLEAIARAIRQSGRP